MNISSSSSSGVNNNNNNNSNNNHIPAALLMNEESFAELVYATERIQNFLITKTTEKAARRIIFSQDTSSVPMNAVSGVPRRRWNVIGSLMEKRMERDEKSKARRKLASEVVSNVVEKIFQ